MGHTPLPCCFGLEAIRRECTRPRSPGSRSAAERWSLRYPGGSLCTTGGPYDIEQFDRGLLGGIDWDDRTGAIRSERSLFSDARRQGANLRWCPCVRWARHVRGSRSDPILYKHPRFHGTLPSSLAGLRRRFLGTEGIEEAAPERYGLLLGLGWPTA